MEETRVCNTVPFLKGWPFKFLSHIKDTRVLIIISSYKSSCSLSYCLDFLNYDLPDKDSML